MAYTQGQEALRNALWNFIGQLAETSAYTGDKAKQSVVALVSEELAKLCKNEDDTINMVIAKPILKSTSWILDQRVDNLTAAASEIETDQAKTLKRTADDIQRISNQLNNYIDKI